MSIQNEIDRIAGNVANTYAVLEALGADMPAEQNSDNLFTTAGSAKAVLYSEQTLTEEQKTQARENIGVVSLTSSEPVDGDIPKVFLTGDEFSNMTTDKNEVNMELEYRSKTKQFHAYILILT